LEGKGLIITEKPSVARDIVAALGGFKPVKGGAYWESDHYLCTFAVGHLFSLLEPDEIDPTFKRWSLSTLPIIPSVFRLKPVPEHKQRIELIRELITRRDVRFLVNACDAAREGELIFREITKYTDAKQWVKRLWLQSMTTEAIRKGFANMRDGTDLDGLGASAECRAQSDWLIGMNATRVFSLRLRGQNDAAPWSVGRVQTPTLAILVDRELEILGHRSEPYFRVKATFDAGSHKYEGTWFDPKFKANDLKPELRDDRVFDKAVAVSICEAIEGAPAVATETREESKRFAPYLFNLTGLQKYMASRYKWNSKRTLDAAQRCYESHKVITYPRTSSSCLPADYRGEVNRLLDGYAGDSDYGPFVESLKKTGLQNQKRNFNDEGVSDHFAIIPTGVMRSLSGDDERLYDAVVRRFFASFMPPAIFDKVKRLTIAASQHFRTGPVETMMEPGWMQVYRKQDQAEREEGEEKLPPLSDKPGEKSVKHVSSKIEDKMTVPPPRISEAGLLSLMERAGKHLADEELASAMMSAEGLGTAATRADIIQNLKLKKYVDETLRPTFKGIHLIETLKKIKAERLTSPALTGRLELKLAEVEKEATRASEYMREISDYVREVVHIAKSFSVNDLGDKPQTLGPCSECRDGSIYESFETYECLKPGEKFLTKGCGFKIYKNLHGRYLDRSTLSALLHSKHLKDVEGFLGTGGKPVIAELFLEHGRIRLASPVAIVDVTAAEQGSKKTYGENNSTEAPEILGQCPIHKPGPCKILALRNSYLCEERLKQLKEKKTDISGFWLARKMCGKEIGPDVVKQLLASGNSKVIKGFVSKAGNKFNASLELLPSGSVSFVFEKSDRPNGAGSDQKAGASAHKFGGKKKVWASRSKAKRPAPEREF
jgi:DNA topoisomerase-3